MEYKTPHKRAINQMSHSEGLSSDTANSWVMDSGNVVADALAVSLGKSSILVLSAGGCSNRESRPCQLVYGNPSNPPVAECLYQEGFEYSSTARQSLDANEASDYHQLAIGKFTEALEVYEYHNYYATRADSYFRLERYEEALNDMNDAIRVMTESGEPVYWMHYYSRGSVYIHLGQNQRAIQDIDKGLEHDAGIAGLYDLRSTAYLNLGQTVKANNDKARACSLDGQYC